MGKTNRKKIFKTALYNEKRFCIVIILIETLTYTFSFLISGLAKKDIFNLLEGKKVTLGIHSLTILTILNIVAPLLINCVKQINAGLSAKLEARIKKNIKISFLDKILSVPIEMNQLNGYGEIISLFRNECEDVVANIMEYYYQIPKIVLSVSILIVMFCINPIFAAISLVPTFGIVVFIKYLEKHIVTNRVEARNATSNITEYMENIFSNIEYFKLAVDIDGLIKIFEKKCDVRAYKERKDRVLDKVLSIFSGNSAGFVMGIVLLVAIPLYRSGRFSVGEFVMFEYYYAFLDSLPDALGKLIRRNRQMKVALERISVEENICSDKAFYDAGKVKIELMEENGEKRCIEACKGETIFLKGNNEVERSIFLQRIFRACLEEVHNCKCQYVPQYPILIDDTVKNNICFGEAYDIGKMEEVLKKMDLVKDINTFDYGIESSVGKRGEMVSGGQRKRIGIARALYAEADILFIDGLSESVDSNTEEIMISSIIEQTNAIVFVSTDKKKVIEKMSRGIEI